MVSLGDGEREVKWKRGIIGRWGKRDEMEMWYHIEEGEREM